ncbi:phage tail tape measure protein [Propionibacteriaceae bacterium Y1700]|uniref:phage tail tape measure protein n=1 Tax=Microlunatus sp. Y1700 TaxID=3418487 RepID=UPI003DA6D051
MADRTVRVRLEANVAGFQAAMARAATSAQALGDKTQKSIGSTLSNIEKNSAAYSHVGSQMMKAGAIGAAGVALVTKAAMDWESAWAGVSKAVDGTPQQMAALEGELRGLAKTLPATHTEIAGVAEAAGQLGIAREDIAGFTKTMINLGETTNLSADEAATSLAQMMNIMGTASQDVDRMGAAIVALGNDGASTEKEIVSMAQRIAGAGNTIGLSETDVLGFASALASVGIEAEAGGTAISTSMLRIEKAVRAGGDDLEILAETAGMTSEQFAQAFQEDAAGAINAFVVGLGKVQKSGGDTTQILTDLGITGVREADALRRLSGAGDLLSESLDTSAKSWEENSALAEEAEKRYQTTEAKISIAMNTIKDSMIDAGAVMLPIVAQIAEGAAKLAGAFDAIPGPVKSAGTVIASIASVALLVGGGLMKLAVSVAETRAAMDALAKSSPGAVRGIRGLSIAGGVAVGITALVVALGELQNATTNVSHSATDARIALAELAKTGDMAGIDKLFKVDSSVFSSIDGLGDAIKAVSLNANDAVYRFGEVGNAMLPLTSELEQAKQQFALLDQQLAQMDPGQASQAFAELSRRLYEAEVPVGDIIALFPEMAEETKKAAEAAGYKIQNDRELVAIMGGQLPPAMQKAKEAAEQNAGAMDGQSTAIDGTASAAEKAAKALEEMRAEQDATAEAALAASNAQIAFEQALDDTSEAAKENGKNLNLDTQAGRDNQSALNGLIERSRAYIEQLESTSAGSDKVAAAKKRAAAEILKTAKAMGMERSDALDLIATMGLIPDEVSTDISAPGAKPTKKQVDEINKALDDMPPEKRARIISEWMSGGYKAAKRAIDSLPASKTTTLTTRHVAVYSETGKRGRVGTGPTYGRAYGGRIPGASPHDRADNIPVAATAGEWMIQRPSVRLYGDDIMADLNAGRIDPRALRAAVYGERRAFGGEIGGREVPQASGRYMPPPSKVVTTSTATSQTNYITQPEDPRIIAEALGRGLTRAMARAV